MSKYVSDVPIPGTNWSIAITVPENEVTAKLAVLRWSSLSTIAIVLLLTIFVIFMVASSITRPLIKLKKVAYEIANGDLSVTAVDVHSEDELRYLARAFENWKKLWPNLNSNHKNAVSNRFQKPDFDTALFFSIKNPSFAVCPEE